MRPRQVRTELAGLRALLARRIDDAAAEALRREGCPAGDQLDELSRLERLVRLREAALADSRWRWAVPAVALVTLLALTILLFTRVSSTDVEIDLTVSEIGFHIPSVEALSNQMSVTTLGVSGLTAIDLPGGDHRAASDLSLLTGLTPAGSLDVNAIAVPAGTKILLRGLEGSRHYELSITGAPSALVVSANGPVRIIVPPDVDERQVYAFPRPIGLERDSGEIRLDLTLAGPADAPSSLRTPLPIESLSLSRRDEFYMTDPTAKDQKIVRDVSTIRSGTIYFEDLDGKTYAVRSGEDLNFVQSSGQVRQWRMNDSGIGVRFQGTVRGLTTGWSGARRSLMPTRLDWFRAQHGVTLLWGTTAYVVGAFITVLGWWRRQP